MGNLHEDVLTFIILPHLILLRMRNFADKICTENQNMYFMFKNYFQKIILF
jgi:hypothetical protein